MIRSRQRNTQLFPNPNLRPHAVSVLEGDYADYNSFTDEDEDDGYEIDETIFDKFNITNQDFTENKAGGGNEIEDDEEEKWHQEREQTAFEEHKQDEAQRARWIENAKPPVRVAVIDDNGRSYGRGGRKESTARVWVYPGEGVITVNRRAFLDFFPRESHREMILSPFIATGTCGMFDVTVQVEGGGVR